MSGAVKVHVVLEGHANLREAELGQRAQFHHAGQTRHLAFERERYELFDFLGRKRGHGGVDEDLRIGDVRHGVNRQPQCRPYAHADEDERGQQHERPLPER